MNLESIAKYFAPKSPMLSDSPRATASDGLTGTDIMAALGLVNAKCGFGFDLYLAKIGVSTPDRAMELLYESAERLSIRFNIVSELSQDVRKRVLEVLCAFAYQDYTRSAASVRKCTCCDGTGFTEARCSPINAHIRGASHLIGQRCPERFAQATGRAGAKCAKWSKLNAQPVTERVLSAIRVAAMGKERYWIKRPASALGYR
jgi:hypothetical protein